jgi:hypothetical protein
VRGGEGWGCWFGVGEKMVDGDLVGRELGFWCSGVSMVGVWRFWWIGLESNKLH